MRPLLLTVALAGGRGRAVLMTLGTALVSGLLLVAVAVVRMGLDAELDVPRYAHLSTPLQTAGTRGGAAFGVLLLAVPVLALLNQVARLGTDARTRRYAALRVAGATAGDLRRWGAVEVGAPSAVGALLGLPTWWLLRRGLGADLATSELGALVPANGPGAWTPVVLAAVVAVGLLIGVRSAVQQSLSADGAGRPVRAPWGSVVLLVLVVAVLVGPWLSSGSLVGILEVLVPTASVVALAGLTPWVARAAATLVARRTSSAAALLAARRLVADSRPAARAACAAGAAGMTIGVCGALLPEMDGSGDLLDQGDYADPTWVVAGLACLALVLVALSLAVHITDRVATQRRSYAALAATGFPTRTLTAALRWEALMACLPVAMLGCLLGSPAFGTRSPSSSWFAAAMLTTLVVTVASVYAASAALVPVVRQAVATGSVRTG